MESLSMNGGDGPNSYKKNSIYQRESVDRSKGLIQDFIREKLQPPPYPTNTFTIADLGCSVGPNTLSVVHNVIEAVEQLNSGGDKGGHRLEFQVFFNDHATNDFNTLFASLPSDGRYFASGIPGSFRGRLFPSASLNFVHSSSALHWLSLSPDRMFDRDFKEWNNGRVSYFGAAKEVVEGYKREFEREMEEFFKAREEEMVVGGLMALHIPGRLSGTHPGESTLAFCFHQLGVCLHDMVREGLVMEAKFDSFNLPIFIPSASEFRQAAEASGHFLVERFEEWQYPPKLPNLDHITTSNNHIRAAFEGLISHHFGGHIADELFLRNLEKLKDLSRSSSMANGGNLTDLFLLVKRI